MRITYWLCSCLCLFFVQLKAQTSVNKNGLTYKFVITDYLTLSSVHQSLNDPDLILHAEYMNYAGEIGYFRNINKSLNLGLPLRIGSIDSYDTFYGQNDTLCQPCFNRIANEFFFGADIVAVYKFNNDYLLKEDFFIAPYILFGVGGMYLSISKENFDFQIPMGLGLNIKLTELLYLQAQFEYRKSLVIKRDNFAISFGLAWLLNFKKKE